MYDAWLRVMWPRMHTNNTVNPKNNILEIKPSINVKLSQLAIPAKRQTNTAKHLPAIQPTNHYRKHSNTIQGKCLRNSGSVMFCVRDMRK